MNPHCECPAAGFCQRHKIEKGQREFDLCKGVANTVDCGRKYWFAWEQGKLGAAAPERPVLTANWPCEHTRGVGDMVARGIKAATFGMVKPCGGCNGRAATLNHFLPLSDPPPVEAVEFTEPVKRNVLFFLWPSTKSEAWKWNCDQLMRRASLFNGRRIVTIATSVDAYPPEMVKEYLRDFTDEFIIVKNDKNRRETVGWVPMLERVESRDLNEVTFCCHGKSARYGVQKDSRTLAVTARWAEAMYETCLDDWPSVREALRTKAMAGSFKLYGMFKVRHNHRWIYSGTFYWFRNADVFARNWRYVDRHYWGTESWPGHMFRPEETACLCLDNAGNLYSEEYWETTAGPAVDQWRAERGHPIVASQNPMDSRFAVITASWNGYWNRFGRQFVTAINQMIPRPAEVVVVTDEPVNDGLFPGVKFVRPQSPVSHWHWFNEAVAASTAPWVLNCGIDDLLFPDALRGLDLSGDVVAYGGIEDGAAWLPDQEAYSRILQPREGNPMRGGMLCRREVFLRHPWRAMIWPDWAQWIEFAKAGVDVKFDLKPRFEHRRHAAAHALFPSAAGEAEIEQLRESLR